MIVVFVVRSTSQNGGGHCQGAGTHCSDWGPWRPLMSIELFQQPGWHFFEDSFECLAAEMLQTSLGLFNTSHWPSQNDGALVAELEGSDKGMDSWNSADHREWRTCSDHEKWQSPVSLWNFMVKTQDFDWRTSLPVIFQWFSCEMPPWRLLCSDVLWPAS